LASSHLCHLELAYRDPKGEMPIEELFLDRCD
jgi:hypothetical protein